MNVDIHGAPIYFEIPILGGIKITASLVVTWGVMLVLTLVCIFLTHGMKVNNISKRQAIAEKIVLTAENFVRSNMGEAWMEWTPFISAIFALSIFSSLASLIGLWSPTADVSTTLAWALVVFVIMTYFKLKTNGLGGYLKGFCDPIFLMAPFNVLGEVFTPISMAFRHFGNIAGGSVLTALIYGGLSALSSFVLGWIPSEFISSIPIFQVGIPAVLSIYFDLFTGCIQALVFCMLTMVYVGAACPPPAPKPEKK